jgi:hypothetical protein
MAGMMIRSRPQYHRPGHAAAIKNRHEASPPGASWAAAGGTGVAAPSAIDAIFATVFQPFQRPAAPHKLPI